MDSLVQTEVAEFNELANKVYSAGQLVVVSAWKAGELAARAKADCPHGEWLDFVEENYEPSLSTVTRWIKLYKKIPQSKIVTLTNLTEALALAAPPKEKKPPKDKGHGQESDPETPGNGMDRTDAPGTEDKTEAAAKVKSLANQHRDKLARAICDYHEMAPNRRARDRLVKLVQEVELW